MITQVEMPPTTADPELDPSPVNVRIKISALWTAMLFVFAYVDIFGLYRADIRADIEAGQIGGGSPSTSHSSWEPRSTS